MRFLCTLALLEFRQYAAIRERAGLGPLSPPDRSHFRASCFRQASARISAALVTATVMHLTAAPSFLRPTYLSHRNCTSYCPGLADLLPRRRQLASSSPRSLSFCASSLSSLP